MRRSVTGVFYPRRRGHRAAGCNRTPVTEPSLSLCVQVILMATTDQNCFVVKLQTSHETSEFSPEKKLENLTGDIDATIIKQIENYLLFNTSFLVKYQLLVH